jgi:hypothetical protein
MEVEEGLLTATQLSLGGPVCFYILVSYIGKPSIFMC